MLHMADMLGLDLSMEDVNSIWASLDADSSGKVSAAELDEWWKKQWEKQKAANDAEMEAVAQWKEKWMPKAVHSKHTHDQQGSAKVHTHGTLP